MKKADPKTKNGAGFFFSLLCQQLPLVNHPRSVFAEELTFHMIHPMESETCNYVSRFSAAMKRGSSLRYEPLAITQLVAAIIVLGTSDLLSKTKAP